MKPSREQLLGYLLGALEPAEIQQVEAELNQQPALRQELARLRKLLENIGLDEPAQPEEPPPGLAQRVCDTVAQQADSVSPIPVQLSPMAFGALNPGLPHRWLDVITLTLVILVAIALIFPSIQNQRWQASRNLCQYRLQDTGLGMLTWADRQPDRRYPAVPREGNRAVAGIVASQLVHGQCVQEPVAFVCPSSKMSKNLAGWHLPTPEEVDQAFGKTLDYYQRTMGGSYAYNMGYLNQGDLVPGACFSREGYALIADVPALSSHDGKGVNVFYEDGHVCFLLFARDPALADDPYHNRKGETAAGTDLNDAALGGSDVRPLPVAFPASPSRR